MFRFCILRNGGTHSRLLGANMTSPNWPRYLAVLKIDDRLGFPLCYCFVRTLNDKAIYVSHQVDQMRMKHAINFLHQPGILMPGTKSLGRSNSLGLRNRE